VPYVLSAVLASAGAGEESAHSNPLVPETSEIFWGLISFVILFALLSKFVFPKVAKTLEERTANIEGKLDEAERERRQAQDLLRQYEQKIDEANAESTRILEQARANADRLEAELRGKAEEQAARIVEKAQETIQAERDRALQSLRGEVGSLAVDLATRVVGESLDRERQLRLVDQYINELGSTAGSGSANR
jgi:F-type H+-transporting ATPase subunit b